MLVRVSVLNSGFCFVNGRGLNLVPGANEEIELDEAIQLQAQGIVRIEQNFLGDVREELNNDYEQLRKKENDTKNKASNSTSDTRSGVNSGQRLPKNRRVNRRQSSNNASKSRNVSGRKRNRKKAV